MPESEGKRPSALAASQRDNKAAQKYVTFLLAHTAQGGVPKGRQNEFNPPRHAGTKECLQMAMKNRKLGRTSDQRRAMLRAMTTYLLENGQIKTTYARAKEGAPIAEKMITLAKKNNLAAYRQVLAYVTKEDVAKKLFDQIGPKYADRNGGYTRVLKMGPRRGDAAEMAIIQLV